MSTIPRLFLIALLLPSAALPQSVYVPDELRGWTDWVLEGKEYRDCPFFFDRGAEAEGDFVCAWPGALSLEVFAGGARFDMQWRAYGDEQWLALPGSTDYWPDAVTVDGRPALVTARGDEPGLRLGPGTYRVSGSFAWDERPGVLRVPQAVGLVELTVDGRGVAKPERNRSGVFLGERRTETEARDVVQAQVFRLLADDVPTRLTTRLQLDVAGRVREELFGPLLPEGFVPLELQSPLPARLEPDGNLRVQVRPGRWIVTVVARGPDAVNSLVLRQPQNNLPAEEVWSYAANDLLRVTVVEGLAPVDPAQANVPEDWRMLPAFRGGVGDTLTIAERSRGLVGADNQLTLDRQMWLDFDGGGFIVSDRVGGAMQSGWRMDMRAPYALLSAREGGEDLLVTVGAEEGLTGVELRRAAVDLGALGRAGARDRMPVTGWAERMTGVTAVLNLPPGHKLFAAPGVDRAEGSWVSQWHLLDFFLVLIITIGTWRLFGRVAGIVALCALTLSFHQAGAPGWLWLNMLVAVALMRVAPAGKFAQIARGYELASAALLLLVLVPFFATQLRIGLYPQLEPQRGWIPGVIEFDRGAPEIPADAMLAPQAEEMQIRQMAARESRVLSAYEGATGAMKVASDRPDDGRAYSRYAPNAVVQAGLGRPDWQWNRYRLEWGGPVDAAQSMRLLILPAWAVSALRFLQVALLLALAAVIAAEVLRRRFRLPGGIAFGRVAGSVVAGVIVSGLLGWSPGVQAQTPDPQLLEELERRLMQPPECAPRCAEVVSADVEVSVGTLNVRLGINALADVAVPLPGSAQGWRPAAIVVDAAAGNTVLRGPDETLWLRLPPGRHTVTLRGPLPEADSVEVPFPAPPRVVRAAASGWLVAGIRDQRLVTGSLQLTRVQTTAAADGELRWEASRFPAFARVTRTLRLDLDWSVETVVERLAPAQGAITLEVPLLDGESVLTEAVPVRDGKALVSMEPLQRVLSWRSSLERRSPLTLTAGPTTAWQETWQVGVGSVWHAQFSGVPESGAPQFDGAARLAAFYPRGAETLAIETTRPEGSPGPALVFDSVELTVDAGTRSRDVNLALDYRSTRGSQHVLRLPEGAELTQVWIDGNVEPLRAEDGELTVPVLPGEHRIAVSWRMSGDIGTVTRTPAVDVGAPASNIDLSLTLPPNRWLLGTGGPPLGPAVLYWPELVALLLFAAILGRVPLTPLKTRHWLLLGLGFSTFSWLVFAWVAAWLLASGARQRLRDDVEGWQFNTAQVVIAALTVTALLAIVSSLPQGLLGMPDMHVTGHGSSGNALRWFGDRSDSVLPTGVAWSVPLLIYKALILAWALWLSFALLRWLPWVWQCFSSQGYWRPAEREGKAGGSKG